MTGTGPDILFSSNDGTFTARAPLLDLYTFIDADPELSRSDFFPNILQGLERADGLLPMITQNFTIQTMTGTVQTLGHINNWTFPAFFALGEEHRHIPNPFSDNRSKKQFLSYMMIYTLNEFIDMEAYKANFDSESFITLLEMTTFFSEAIDPDLRPSLIDKYFKVQRGEQILAFDSLADVSFFHIISYIIGDSIFAIGFPTADGGQHIALPGDLFGINAASLYADAAWSFIRTLLLESADVELGFPLHIDLFNERVDEVMAPAYEKDIGGNYMYDSDGNLIYTCHIRLTTPDGTMLLIYEMTEAAERELRRIINSAKVRHFLSTPELWHIINEELDNFLDGVRSAEATARSLQSRVQRYLSEQELIS